MNLIIQKMVPKSGHKDCGAHEQRAKGGRFDIEDTRATRRSRYRRTSILRKFEVGTFLSTTIGAVKV